MKPTPEEVYEVILERPDSDGLREDFELALRRAGDSAWAELVGLQRELFRHETGQKKLEIETLISKERQERPLRYSLLEERSRLATPGGFKGKRKMARGLVEWASLDAAAFLKTAPDLFRSWPLLHLQLSAKKAEISELASSSALAHLKSLSLRSSQLGDREAKLLAASPYLGKLRWLDLSGNRIGRAGVEALGLSKGLSGVRHLLLEGNPADPFPDPWWDQGKVIGNSDCPRREALKVRCGAKSWLQFPSSQVLPDPLYLPTENLAHRIASRTDRS